MRKIILFLISFNTVAAAHPYLQEVQKIEQSFFRETQPKKEIERPLANMRRQRVKEPVQDLEQLYFQDSIKTKAAAPARPRRVRSR